MKQQNEFYISVDVETNGPCPGIHSMLQFGAVFFDYYGNEFDFAIFNLHEIEGGVADEDTMNWWMDQEKRNPGSWSSMREFCVTPTYAMQSFTDQVLKHKNKTKASPVVVGYPSGFDFTWLYWYLHKYTGDSCVGFSALDMKSFAMARLGLDFRASTKRSFPKSWFSKDLPHTHNALDDAREQGHMFLKMAGIK